MWRAVSSGHRCVRVRAAHRGSSHASCARMRWHTYNKQVDKFDHYEGMLDALCQQALMRILRKG